MSTVKRPTVEQLHQIVDSLHMSMSTREVADYRDRRQADQDLEEKGTPIPLRFLSPDERAEHLAPPPRLVP